MNCRLTMILKTMVLLMVSLMLLNAQERFEAEVYWQGSDRGSPVFIYKNDADTTEAGIMLGQYYYEPNGTLFASEELFLNAENEWEKHVIDFLVLEERSELFRKGDKVDLVFTKKEKRKERTRDLEIPLLFGPLQQSFIRENLDLLRSGEPVYFYVPAAEFSRLIQFKIERTDNTPYRGEDTFVIVMNTRSIILSWFLGDSYFVIDKDDGTIREIHGSSVLKQEVNGKWEYIDVDIYFEYL
ncbi:MAG: hypothetical protein U5N26_04335 [Candidatus Marinimicrobia bacterium]|nr:hypothetical protein [Candidatus Neomarinimicrobiota bacterium]